MGGGASVPENIDLGTFRQLTGDKFSMEVFIANVDPNGTIPREKLLMLEKQYYNITSNRANGNKPLEALSTDDVVKVCIFYAIPAEDIIRSKNITGATLAQIITESDLNRNGFKELPIMKKKVFLVKIADMRQHGVSMDRVASTGPSNESLNDVVSALAQAISSSGIAVERALDAIPRYINNDPERHFLLGTEVGVVINVLSLLRQNITSKSVCFKGLTAIRLLCRYGPNYSTTCEETVQLLVGAGACEAVVNSMQAFAVVPAVAEAGCWAIRNLAANNDDNKEKLGRAGACGAVVSALRTHLSVPTAVEASLWALHNLAVDDDNRAKLGDLGACELVAAALSNTSLRSNPSVAEQGCESVLNLAHCHLQNGARLGVAGACEVVTDILREYMGHVRVLESACGAVLNLSHNNDDNKARFGNSGACEAVVAVLRVHMAVPEVVEQASGAVLNMSFIAPNKARLRAAGVKATMAAVMSDGRQTEEARYWARNASESLY